MADEAVQWGCCANTNGTDLEEKYLKCSSCEKYYHYACTSIKEHLINMSTWNCPTCMSSAPKVCRNDSTPIRNVSMNRGSKRQAIGSPSPPSSSHDKDDIRSVIKGIIKEEFSVMLVKINDTIISTINRELEPLKKEKQFETQCPL